MLLSRRTFTSGALASLVGCADRRANEARGSPSAPVAAPAPVPAPVQIGAPALPLVRAFPGLAGRLPRVSLGSFPTPVGRAEDLGRALGVGSLWVKRDDLGGARYGGGKTRKLELLLADARAKRARTVVTFGAVGSNHAVATALYATELGMKAVLMLLPGPPDDRVRRNLLADLHFGADIHLSPAPPRAEAAARRIVLRERGDAEPYVIATGGSSPLGNAAFVSAAFELRDQIEAGVVEEPDVVYIALGTMGCAAGLAVGLRAAGLRSELVAVRASNPGSSSEGAFLEAIDGTSAFLRAADPAFPAASPAPNVRIDGRHLGAGYGLSTPEGLRAVDLARQHAGLELEPVYTGKAMAAIASDVPRLAGKIVLFWNTHNSRPLDLGATDWRDLPAELHAYFAT